MRPRPLMLLVLDGWGLAPPGPGNATTLAEPANFQRLRAQYPFTTLEASGRAVGLPAGQMGNSEVGHLNIGAGRVVYQEITRISEAIEDGSFFANPVLTAAVAAAREGGGSLHLMGLVSDGGVHSHLDHLFALLELCRRLQCRQVFVHCFLDGRDVPPSSARSYLQALERRMAELGVGRIATVMGRYWAMDRDRHWDRNQRAYRAMVLGEGVRVTAALEAVEESYRAGVTDEFVEPAVVVDGTGAPVGTVRDGDAVIFFNFRADRARQITRAFVDREFQGFPRQVHPQVHFVCMTQYDVTIAAPVAFAPQDLSDTLGEVLARHGLRQLRIAETEKYAHVTFFFNGGVEQPNPLEERVLIPSPPVPTYDLKPEMSAFEVTERVLAELERDCFDVIVLNYANPDMVGHTGMLEPAVKAIKAVDHCLGEVVSAVQARGGEVLVTADHGNAETMIDPESGEPHTAHTSNPVPFILVSERFRGCRLRQGRALRDIAPTMLEMLGLPLPAAMTGASLIEPPAAGSDNENGEGRGIG